MPERAQEPLAAAVAAQPAAGPPVAATSGKATRLLVEALASAAAPEVGRAPWSRPVSAAARAGATAPLPEKARVHTPPPVESHRPAKAAAATPATEGPMTQAMAAATRQTDRQVEQARPEARRPEACRPEACRPEACKPEACKPEARKPEACRQQPVAARMPVPEWLRAWAGRPVPRSDEEPLEWRVTSEQSARSARVRRRSTRAVARPAPAAAESVAVAQSRPPQRAPARSARVAAAAAALPCRSGRGGATAQKPQDHTDRSPTTRPSLSRQSRPRSGV